MGTKTIQINCNVRPVRTAFLVEKPDPAAIEKIFSLNSILWGGMLNPVVVLDGSARSQVGAFYAGENVPYAEEQFSLLKAFDPDIFINYSNARLPSCFAPFERRTFPLEAIRLNRPGAEGRMLLLEV